MSTNPFPNVRNKLSAPAKKSAFEKQRLEAEAKRLREEAETAAVYKDFVASFDEGPPPPDPSSQFPTVGRGGFNSRGRGGPPSAPGRRHFTTPRGGGVGGLRKRNLENAFERDDDDGVFGSGGIGGIGAREKRRMQDSNTGLLAFENSGPVTKPKMMGPGQARQHAAAAAADDSDSDSGSKPHPKPTVLLSSLPPNINKTTITEILAATPLKIDSIRIIPAPPPPGPSMSSPSVRKAATALVTLSADTPSSDIDSAVSSLNGRYIGFGFWLTIVRHLSSTVAGSTPNIPTMGANSNPFGAKAPLLPTTGVGRGGPHRGGFAPPSSFAPPGGRPGMQQQPSTGSMQVHVQPPSDLKVLKLIHRTVENLLTHGPEFEALLMSQDSVRTDEKFSWLWDARSAAGVYYRWKLWEIVTGYSIDKTQVPAVDIFELAPGGANGAGLWVPPKKNLKYEWAGSLRDVVDDEGFMSDELDEDDSDREDYTDRPVGLAGGEGKKTKGYLGVLERAKLIHLISRMPIQTSKVRRGDVARVMAFALEHAEGGMGEEVVDVLVSNVLRPLSFTKAAKSDPDSDSDGNDSGSDNPPPPSDPSSNDPPDTSSAKIVALWLISDVLSNSSLGVRAAWRYRQLFDTTMRERGVFRHLGEIYRNSGWGRMKAEKFRRSVVEGVLEGWEKWCIFPQTTQEEFLAAFLNPTDEKREEGKSGTSTPVAKGNKPIAPAPAVEGKSRWKTVDTAPSVFNPAAAPVESGAGADVDGAPLVDSDVDGEPLLDDDEDIDGVPLDDDSDEDIPMVEPEPELKLKPVMQRRAEEEEEEEEEEERPGLGGGVLRRAEEEEEEKRPGLGGPVTGFRMGGGGGMSSAEKAAASKRKRPKAEDMFADSD